MSLEDRVLALEEKVAAVESKVEKAKNAGLAAYNFVLKFLKKELKKV